MLTKKYICPVCDSKCPMCDDEYQCFECEKLENEKDFKRCFPEWDLGLERSKIKWVQ